MAADGTIRIYTDVDTNGIHAGRKNIEKAMSGIGSTVKKIGGMIAAAFAVQKIAQFGKECLELGSDLAEVQNVVDSVFTTMSGKVDDFAKSAAKNFGLSETMAKQYAGSFGAMAKSFGFAEGEALNMATALTGLSGDVASFYNLSQDEAYTKLKSVFTGETESLKDLGVVMTQSALDQYAMANGFGKTTSAMTEQEKVALRYRFVMDQLSTASGDFLRTSDGWANQVRVLKLQIDSLKATIGQGLINIFTPVIKVINVLLGKLATVANAFKSFTELITGNKSSGSTGSSGAGIAQDDIASLGTDYDNAASGAENLAGATEDAADATKAAAKEAEGYLSPIDTIHKISEKDNLADAISPGSGSGTGGGTGGGLAGAVSNVDYGKLAEGENALDKMGDSLDGILKRLKELKDLFVSGFWNGLGDYKPILSDLKKDIKSIGATLKEIFTDPGVVASANRFANALSYSLGQVIGSAASIGLTIASNLVGGMEKYLTQNKDRIKTYLTDMFDIGTDIATQVGNAAATLADILSVFSSDTAQQITGDLIGIFAEVGMMVTENTAKLTRDIFTMVTQPFINNKEQIKEAIAGTLEAIEPFTNGLLEAVQTIRDGITEVYDNHLKPLFDSVTEGLSSILEKLLEGYNTYLVPVLKGLGDRFQELVDGPLGQAIESVKGALSSLFEVIRLFWETELVPLFSWLAEYVNPLLSAVAIVVGETIMAVIVAVISAIGALADALKLVLDFIISAFDVQWVDIWEHIKVTFTDVWSALTQFISSTWENWKTIFSEALNNLKELISTAWDGICASTKSIWNSLKKWLSSAWNAIKDTASNAWGTIKNKVTGFAQTIYDKVTEIFTSMRDKISQVFEGIVDFIKAPLNEAIGFANSAINSINNALGALESALSFGPWEIPTPFGTQTIGFSVEFPRIGEIPYLASGAVIPPNAPFMAMLGDQRNGNNIEAPEGLIRRIVREETGGSGNNVYRIPVTISGRELMEIVIDEAELKRSRNGKNPFNLGVT